MHPRIQESQPGFCPLCGMALTTITVDRSAYRPLLSGGLAAAAMLGVYFGVLSLLSGWDFTLSEFTRLWYLVLALALGFGIQVGLYAYLKQRLIRHHAARKVVTTSGATSTAAMISCCAHYVANVVPVIGATGLVTFVAQYQVELFWAGLAFNAGGVAFVVHRILKADEHARC
jgi:Cu+-exporting ATPase